MKLPTCRKCGSKVQWQKIYTSVWMGYKPIKCDECGEVNEISSYTMGKVSLLVFVPLLLLGMFMTNETTIIVSILTVLIAFSLVSTIVPYIVKFKENQ
ncbi:MAG: hypothetical protein LRY73_16520 [Bacillus sp. (in: Bacteria)]|nr:hypothetical protein [Bacillus sp. (in: firmicutes)]